MMNISKEKIYEYSEVSKSDWHEIYTEMCQYYDIHDMQTREKILTEVI